MCISWSKPLVLAFRLIQYNKKFNVRLFSVKSTYECQTTCSAKRQQQQTISDYHTLIEVFDSELTFQAPPLSHIDH